MEGKEFMLAFTFISLVFTIWFFIIRVALWILFFLIKIAWKMVSLIPRQLIERKFGY